MAKRLTVFVAVFAALLSLTLSVQAEILNYYWEGGHQRPDPAGDAGYYLYFTTANWNKGSQDGTQAQKGLNDTSNSITAYILNDAINDTQTSNPIKFDNTYLGNAVVALNIGQTGNTNTATVYRSGGNLVIQGAKSLNIGDGGTFNFAPTNTAHYIQINNNGNLSMTGGSFNYTSGDYLDIQSGGTFSMSGGTFYSSRSINVNGTLSITGGTFSVNSMTNNGTLTHSGGTFSVNSMTNNGTFTHSGGTLTTDILSIQSNGSFNYSGGTFTASTFTLNDGGTFIPTPGYQVSVSDTANLSGTIDMSGFSNYIGTYGEKVTILTASTISETGTLTYSNIPNTWTKDDTATNSIIFTYNGGETNYYWTGYAGPDSAHNNEYCFYTAKNWKVGGTQITSGGLLSAYSNVNCYILDTSVTNNNETSIVRVWIDWSTLGVKSLTVGNGSGSKSAKVYRDATLTLSDTITINEGGMAELSDVNITGGNLKLTGGTLKLGSGGLRSTSGTYTIEFSGGTLGNYNANNWSTALNAEIKSNTVTFSPAEDRTITWNGILSGAGGLAVDGVGTLILSNANTYGGGTTISNGTLKLTDTGSLGTGAVVNNDTLEFNVSSTQTFSKDVSGNGIIKKTGAGTLTLDSPSANSISCDVIIDKGTVVLTYPTAYANQRGLNRFTGSVTINEGAKLQCDKGDAIGYANGAVSFILNGGELFLNGSNETFQNKTIILKQGTLSTTTNATCTFDIFGGGTSFIVEANENATSDNPTISYVNGWVRLRNKSSNFNITVAENAELIFNKNFKVTYNSSEHNYPLVKQGAGVMVFEGDNTYTKGTIISEGTLVLRENGTLGAGDVENNAVLEFAHSSDKTFSNVISGTGSVTKTGSAGVLDITGANTYSGGTTITNGAIRLLGNGTLGSGEISIGSSSSLWFGGDLVGVTISNDISGAGSIVKQGYYNTVTLNGNLTNFTGQLTINGETNYRNSTISLSGANANLLNSSGVTVNGTLDVTGYTGSTAMQLNSLTGSGIVNIGSNALTLNNNTEADSIFSGAINGTSGLTKTGTGTLTLSGANTYTGMTTVSAGVLKLTGDAVVANGPVTVGDNGTLVYNVDGEPEPLTIGTTNKIFSTGQVIKTGEGTLKLCALYAEADKMIDVQSLTVSSGRVDIKEYFYGKLIVDSEGTFSPGNSVGSLTIGDGTYGGGFILNEAGAELLMEIGGSAASANDVLIVEGDITLVDGSVITLVNNSNLGLGESFTAILSAENSANLDVLGHIQTTDFTDLKYVEINDATHGTVYAITGRTLNANEVPEPSTWALLILGAAGLLYWRKKKNA